MHLKKNYCNLELDKCLGFHFEINKKEGLSHTFLISYQDCTWIMNFVTSKSIENKNEIIESKKIKEIKDITKQKVLHPTVVLFNRFTCVKN